MSVKKSIDDDVRRAVIDVLGPAQAEDEICQEQLLQMFGTGIPVRTHSREKPKDEGPLIYNYLTEHKLDPFDKRGPAPSYYKKLQYDPDGVTCFDVFKEQAMETDYDWGKMRQFIKQHYNPDNPYAMYEGMECGKYSRDDTLRTYYCDQIQKRNDRRNPVMRRRRRFKIACLVSTLACVGILSKQYFFSIRDSLIEDAETVARASPSAKSNPDRVPNFSAVGNAGFQNLPAPQEEIGTHLYECIGISYAQISRDFTGTAEYAQVIRDYNRENTPGFQYRSNLCKKGQEIRLPPRMIVASIQRYQNRDAGYIAVARRSGSRHR